MRTPLFLRNVFDPIIYDSVIIQDVMYYTILLFQISGLSEYVGNQLVVLDKFDSTLMVFLISCIVALATEVTSNTATSQLLLPIMFSLVSIVLVFFHQLLRIVYRIRLKFSLSGAGHNDRNNIYSGPRHRGH